MKIKVVRNRFSVIENYITGRQVLDLGVVDARPDGQKKYKSTGLHIFLAQHASRLVGVDIDEAGVQDLRSEGYEVFCGNVEEIDIGMQFDCIVAGEVIEHLSNPGLFLENMKRHLKEDGHLIITAPNAFSIVSFWRILKKNRIKVHAEHTCWYDPKTLEQLLVRHDFKTDEFFFSNKPKWYLGKNFYKLSHQLPRIICNFRSYLSGQVIVVAQKS